MLLVLKTQPSFSTRYLFLMIFIYEELRIEKLCINFIPFFRWYCVSYPLVFWYSMVYELDDANNFNVLVQ